MIFVANALSSIEKNSFCWICKTCNTLVISGLCQKQIKMLKFWQRPISSFLWASGARLGECTKYRSSREPATLSNTKNGVRGRQARFGALDMAQNSSQWRLLSAARAPQWSLALCAGAFRAHQTMSRLPGSWTLASRDAVVFRARLDIVAFRAPSNPADPQSNKLSQPRMQ